jgi:hypothetical protein
MAFDAPARPTRNETVGDPDAGTNYFYRLVTHRRGASEFRCRIAGRGGYCARSQAVRSASVVKSNSASASASA